MEVPLLSERALDNLKWAALQAQPNETGGILHGDKVYIVLNRATEPKDNFLFTREDIVAAVKQSGCSDADLLEGRVALWHSHPGGGVGPSRIDMRQKTPLPYHLVVAIVDGDIIPTWY